MKHTNEQTKFSQITKLLDGDVYAMVSTRSGVVHFAVKDDKYRAFVPANRTVILIRPFDGKQPSHEWLVDNAIKALEQFQSN